VEAFVSKSAAIYDRCFNEIFISILKAVIGATSSIGQNGLKPAIRCAERHCLILRVFSYFPTKLAGRAG